MEYDYHNVVNEVTSAVLRFALLGLLMMLQKIAALEVGVRVDNCVKIGLAPCPFLLHPLDFCFVRPFEYSVASDVISRLLYVLTDAT